MGNWYLRYLFGFRRCFFLFLNLLSCRLDLLEAFSRGLWIFVISDVWVTVSTDLMTTNHTTPNQKNAIAISLASQDSFHTNHSRQACHGVWRENKMNDGSLNVYNDFKQWWRWRPITMGSTVSERWSYHYVTGKANHFSITCSRAIQNVTVCLCFEEGNKNFVRVRLLGRRTEGGTTILLIATTM